VETAKDLEHAQKELRKIASDDLRSTLSEVSRMLSKLREDRASKKGSYENILQTIRALKVKLKQDDHKNIDGKHRKKMIAHETTAMAVKDLEQYHVALDKALMKYHGLKIAEINTIIRELWQITYRGGDIDTIQIQSGQEKKSGASAGKSYNYRVVMRKGDTELDMRGRCSAGQKVRAVCREEGGEGGEGAWCGGQGCLCVCPYTPYLCRVSLCY
jgi:DNA repair protein RAD50